jgi:acyl-CoA synthetase (AMP-forming)/AMP-acid ligase II
MQNDPVNLVQVLEHAARFHGEVEIVSRQVEDDEIHRYTYAEALVRTRKLANALLRLGMEFGDRVATMAWNTYRHLEGWYAISGQGAICHTVNPRLFGEQIQYIINHAEDKIVLVDLSFVPLLEELQDELPTVEHFIVLTDEEQMPETTLRNAVAYETLIADEPEEVQWPSFPEETPSSLCYTSGTTGNPKGVLYTHRSNLLHAYAVNAKDVFGVGCSDSVLMVVPMFHANSWGLAYSCPMVGARLVLPGARMDGSSIYELLDSEEVTFSAAVPTVWNMLLGHLEENSLQLPYLDEVMIGGSAVPRRIVEAFDQDYGVNVVHGWGMTELSPIGTACRLKPFMESFSYEQQVDVRLKQGTPLFGVAMKIVDDDGEELPRDGTIFGRLLVKGPWIVQRYYRDEVDAVDGEGWFDTGDVATIDEYGYMQITDRSKDLIKSGGEWISSVDLENAAMGHADVVLAAVIGIHHPKWEERPLLVVKRAVGATTTAEDILAFLQDKVAKWWLPDDVVFVDEIPLTATGKISKLRLRKQFTDYQLPGTTDS